MNHEKNTKKVTGSIQAIIIFWIVVIILIIILISIFSGQSSNENSTSVIPVSPVSTNLPATPATPAIPVTPPSGTNTLATPATPAIPATPLPVISNPVDMSGKESQTRVLQLINPLLNKYSIFIKSIDTQSSYWESLNQVYSRTIANLQNLQSVSWRNDVQGVIDQLLYEKDLLSKYVDLAKARQSYAKGMIEGYNTAYNKFGTQPLTDGDIKTVNDGISKIDGYISEYNMNNPDSVSATLRARASKIDILVKALFQRLQTSQ